METVIAEVLALFIPAILAYVTARLKGTPGEVAAMQAVAKLEDERAKAKFHLP